MFSWNRRGRREAEPSNGHWKASAFVLILSFACTVALFAVNAGIDVDLADEGYLWYGSAQTARGATPIEDFDSYDPGRYYWNSLWMHLLGDEGLLALRVGESAMQFVGLSLALFLVSKHLRAWQPLFAAAALLSVWYVPRHKTYDHTMAIALIFFAAIVVCNPTRMRFFIAGLGVGVAALFGKNHGFYAIVAYLLLFGYLWYSKKWRGSRFRGFLSFTSGLILGYSPVIAMFSLLPGFRYWFFQDVSHLISAGATNLTLPVPWPWSIEPSRVPGEVLPLLSLGFLFVTLPLAYAAAILFVLRRAPSGTKPVHDVLIAAAIAGAVYYHFALSRADLSHLAQSVHPFLITLLVFPMAFRNGWNRRIAVFLSISFLMFLTWNTAVRAHPGFLYWTRTEPYVPLEIGRDSILVPGWMRDLVEEVRQLEANEIGENEGLLIAPYLPGLYTVLGRDSPLRETYFLFERSEELQKKDVSALDSLRVDFAIIGDVAIDDIEERRFRNTHSLIWEHIVQRFEKKPARGLPPGYELFVRRDQIGSARDGTVELGR
ncbi:MAG TPA: hypothetical protein VLK65_32630 [Vicinamibacteria bacterium]|nr:hypothetical protein [Vicinamibacteria bacterium]